MIHFKINRFILCILLCLTFVASAQKPFQNSLDSLLDDDFFQTATIGVSVYDLTANRSLYNRNERRLCRPASNMKLLTSAAGLHFLTSSYTFCTGLSCSGQIADGCLRGDLYLSGGFDPEFTSVGLDSMVSMLNTAGIRRFEGNVYADVFIADDTQWGRGWSWDDDMETFQPYLTPIPLNKGVVKLKVTPASPGRQPIVQTEPSSAFFRMDNRATTVWTAKEPTKETLHFRRRSDESSNLIEITGSIAAKAKPYEKYISVQLPTEYVLAVFADKLAEKLPGSTVVKTGTMVAPAQATPIGEIRHTLPEVIRQMNKESDNLNAEMMLYALALPYYDLPATTEKGTGQVRKFVRLTGYDSKNISIVDGSGLSNMNYLSPELLVTVLRFMYQSPDFSLYKSSLAEAGTDGTLKNRMKETPAYRKVFAKTGSLTGVSTLSGYVETNNGHLLAFSIMVQNFTIKAREVHEKIDKICERMVEL
ncbi:MAG: D-alanyl-D-alanine carboxypeptidase/D-alanyl-D-alanine-endopeptidase [Bacteroidales bacterium]|jgi:D-alanyl-D-alanine carboxypeptidase/D-alanyl-D-alanine-endopeptidase (penicillin-binding protein 4)|nr:D-alanyl-D-alanine carboxypeptidase/D-alanyl-D-alanine-endopeptidase [Bacteroidales bacterium]